MSQRQTIQLSNLLSLQVVLTPIQNNFKAIAEQLEQQKALLEETDASFRTQLAKFALEERNNVARDLKLKRIEAILGLDGKPQTSQVEQLKEMNRETANKLSKLAASTEKGQTELGNRLTRLAEKMLEKDVAIAISDRLESLQKQQRQHKESIEQRLTQLHNNQVYESTRHQAEEGMQSGVSLGVAPNQQDIRRHEAAVRLLTSKLEEVRKSTGEQGQSIKRLLLKEKELDRKTDKAISDSQATREQCEDFEGELRAVRASIEELRISSSSMVPQTVLRETKEEVKDYLVSWSEDKLEPAPLDSATKPTDAALSSAESERLEQLQSSFRSERERWNRFEQEVKKHMLGITSQIASLKDKINESMVQMTRQQQSFLSRNQFVVEREITSKHLKRLEVQLSNNKAELEKELIRVGTAVQAIVIPEVKDWSQPIESARQQFFDRINIESNRAQQVSINIEILRKDIRQVRKELSGEAIPVAPGESSFSDRALEKLKTMVDRVRKHFDNRLHELRVDVGAILRSFQKRLDGVRNFAEDIERMELQQEEIKMNIKKKADAQELKKGLAGIERELKAFQADNELSRAQHDSGSLSRKQLCLSCDRPISLLMSRDMVGSLPQSPLPKLRMKSNHPKSVRHEQSQEEGAGE